MMEEVLRQLYEDFKRLAAEQRKRAPDQKAYGMELAYEAAAQKCVTMAKRLPPT